ncbi:hypothetical protein QUA43_12435 [Microcoleus sp. N9_B4]
MKAPHPNPPRTGRQKVRNSQMLRGLLYRWRLHGNNKIESTVNTQPFSFSTRPSTLNSQQSTVNSQHL